jgi:hypothetical protein
MLSFELLAPDFIEVSPRTPFSQFPTITDRYKDYLPGAVGGAAIGFGQKFVGN